MEKAQIIFLGSGGGRKIIASQERATGGFVIQTGKEQIHVDPGPGAVVQAARFGIDITETTIILVSHFHIDHCNDVNTMINAITFGGKEEKGTLVTNELNERSNLTKFHMDAIKKHYQIKPGDKTEINKIVVNATRTEGHDDESTVGYKIFTPDFVLGYTSDTSFFPKLIDEFKGCDIMIINVLKPKNKKLKGHLNSDDVVKILKKVKPRLAVIQHFGNSMLKANPIYEARDIQKESGVQTIAAQDGLILDTLSYSTKLNQKTMNLY